MKENFDYFSRILCTFMVFYNFLLLAHYEKNDILMIINFINAVVISYFFIWGNYEN